MKLHWLGAIFSPITLILQSFALFYLPPQLQSVSPLIPALKSNWLIMHVTVMLFSYAALVCGSILSIVFLILNQFVQTEWLSQLILNTDQFSSFKSLSIKNQRIPILLTQIDHYSYRIIGVGFPFLTIGILSGAIWANEAWGSYWSWDPKETWALITWLVFAIYLHTRYLYNWSGLKSSILGATGFILIWICYIGVNLLGKGLHSYGWFT